MQSLRIAILFVCSVCLASSAFAQKAEDNPHRVVDDPLKKPGEMLKIEPMKELFQLVPKGNKLEPKYEGAYQDANGTISRIRTATRSGGGSSSSGNGNWMCYMQGQKFNGFVSHGKSANYSYMYDRINAHPTDDDFQVYFEELDSPQRTVRIGANAKGNFSISIQSAVDGYLFRFSQDASGRIVCQEVSKDNVFSTMAKSFDQFCLKNPEYVQERLQPIFKFVGAGQPVTRYHPLVKTHVISKLQPLDEEHIAEFRKVAENLNARSYKDREAASAAITEEFDKWRAVIDVVIDDEDFPAETRNRLKKVRDSKTDDSARRLFDLALKSKLTSDVSYLVWLLGETDKEEFQTLIVNKLEELTEQSFSKDVKKWETWIADNDSTAKSDEASEGDTEKPVVGFLEQKGPLDLATPAIKQLVKLNVVENNLVLDREHWGSQFGGKSIKEWAAEIEATIKKSNLPAEWFDPGGDYTLPSSDFPQVIFANMAKVLKAADKKKKNPRSVYYGYVQDKEIASRNRYFDSSQISARLLMHKPTPNERTNRFVGGVAKPNAKPPKAAYFNLYLREVTGPRRILEVREWQDKSISLTLISDESGSVVRLMQSAKPAEGKEDRKCWIYYNENDEGQMFAAENFAQLRKDNAEFMAEKIVPVLTKFGITISE